MEKKKRSHLKLVEVLFVVAAAAPTTTATSATVSSAPTSATVAAALAHAAATQRPIHRIAFESNLRSGAQVDVFAEDAARPDAFGARRDATLARLRAARYDCACDATDCDCVGPIAYDGV